MASIPQSATKAERLEFHQEKMRTKRAREARWYPQLTKHWASVLKGPPQHKQVRASVRHLRQMGLTA